MNIRTRRRGKRSLAAILAAMLMASVLAVVAGSPAQAANTSSEVLVDTNDDGVPDAREFGGRDRYDTAFRLATNFGKVKTFGGVPTAFVASGHTLVDAVSVSGLAGFLDAPVLLTPTDSLHGGVADFIEDYGVDTIYVLGGSAAIADSVLEDLEALANEPTVSRIEGADRYATAAAIASQLGGGAAWCGGEDAAAILVNGGDVSLAEAMLVGPIAHRLQLPVLMTAADELPMATTDFIEGEDIEHVIVVGGTDSVSEDVANAVSDAGVDTVTRIAGDTAAATSVALAGLLTGDCKDDLAPVSTDTVALVQRDALPDGVAAAPVLSSTYAGGSLVPILVVGDTLPVSVRDYLAATPQTTDNGDKLNLRIVAIGGTAAVSDSVMQAALSGAASADALSVQIGAGGKAATTDPQADAVGPVDVNKDNKVDGNDAPQVGDTGVRLYFSDNVAGVGADADAQLADLTNKIRDVLEINGAPARLTAVDHGRGTNEACDADVATVTLSSALKPGDTVSVLSGAKLGDSRDQRAVGAASVTVAAQPADRSRPTISVIMIAGRGQAEVTVSEGDPQLPEGDGGELVTIRKVSANATGTVTITNTGLLEFADPLETGDRVTIASGAIEDTAKNKSLQRSFTAIAAPKSPRITSVLLSNLNHSANAVAAVPASITKGGGTPPDDGDSTTSGDDSTDPPDIWILAKGDGAASGAAGNDWSVTFDRASNYSPEKDLDIDVRVNSRDKSVFVRFNNGKAKFADLKAALEGNSAFSALFEVKVDADPDSIAGGACGKAANNDLAIADLVRGDPASTANPDGGMTKVAIQVTFNSYFAGVVSSELLNDVLAATADRGGDAVAVSDVLTALNIDAQTNVTGPKTVARYEATTSNAAMLPQVRDLVTTVAGHAGDSNADPVVPEVAQVANAYAADDGSTAANEDRNAASQVRIGRSSGVEAPK